MSPISNSDNPVAAGIDVLQAAQFEPLRGRRVGLISNHTGLNRDGKPTVDLLHQAANMKLAALFGPEHGIRGLLDEHVPDSKDEATGLPVFSLYGARNHPTPEQLTGLDTLVFDIQDIGARFYTYISTLGLCMEDAAKHGLRFVVLDRPNPLGGMDVEGPFPDPDKYSFTAYHSIPVRHGLTVGELAQMFNVERKLGLDLHVVKAEGWRRGDLWDATDLTWTNPSPNMRSLTQAILYPGIGLLEATNISVGRGTDTPFEVIGAPWMDGRKLAAVLNARDLPGTRFVPIRYTPHSSVHANKPCGGVNIVITARHRFVPVLTGMAIAQALLNLYPKDWEAAKVGNLLVNRKALDALLAGSTAETVIRGWHKDVQAFRKRRQTCFLYE